MKNGKKYYYQTNIRLSALIVDFGKLKVSNSKAALNVQCFN